MLTCAPSAVRGIADPQPGLDQRLVDDHREALVWRDGEAADRVHGPHGQRHLETSSGSATRPSRTTSSPSRSRPSSVAAS